jgi:hypothetical protein
MNKNPLLLFLFASILCLLFSQCKPDDPILPSTGNGGSDLPAPTDTFYVDQELKSYYFFPQGSWWVYQMLDTNVIIYDTALVTAGGSRLMYSGVLPFAWESVGLVIEHSHYPSPPGFVSPHLSISIGNSGGNLDRISMSSQGKLFNYLPSFFSVPIDSTSMAEKSSGTIKTELLDTNSIQIANQVLNNVIHIKHGVINYEYEIWIAKNIGLLKYYNSDDNTHWELINYQIN